MHTDAPIKNQGVFLREYPQKPDYPLLPWTAVFEPLPRAHYRIPPLGKIMQEIGWIEYGVFLGITA